MSWTTRARWGAATAAVALIAGLSLVGTSAGKRPARHPIARLQPWPVEKRALLHELAILRRPQRNSDIDSAPLAHLLNGFGKDDTIDRALIRRATTASGDHVFLIPVKRSPRTGAKSPGLLVAGIGGAGCCATAAVIGDQGTWTTSGPPNRVLLVIPDGVARLRVTLRTGPDPSHPPVVSGRVVDNVIVMRLPFAAETLSGDPITWYAPTGRVVKHFIDSG